MRSAHRARPRRALRPLLLGLLLCARPSGADAQTPALLRVRSAQENLRAAPKGARIAVVLQGAPLAAGASRGDWREVALEGWIEEARVEAARNAPLPLPLRVVAGGAPIHAAPGGKTIARGLTGLLLDEVGRQKGWVHVRRSGWIWSASTEAADATPAPAPPAKGARPARADSAARPAAPAAPAPAGPRALLAGPGGDTVAVLAKAAQTEVVGREGDWVRVRVEGWVPAAQAVAPGGSTDPLRGVPVSRLREAPDEYRGRTLAWTVQFVALQTADSLRSDLRPGEPYLLVRDPDGKPGFVYVAVPADLLPSVRRLAPLQRVEIVGRVRAARSALTGHPVLDLLELHP